MRPDYELTADAMIRLDAHRRFVVSEDDYVAYAEGMLGHVVTIVCAGLEVGTLVSIRPDRDGRPLDDDDAGDELLFMITHTMGPAAPGSSLVVRTLRPVEIRFAV